MIFWLGLLQAWSAAAQACRGADVAWAPCVGDAPTCISGTPATTPLPVPADLKIGMIGDQDVTSGALAVLEMMKEEGVDLIILAGDFGTHTHV